ncbi:MAG: hypothetical protein LBI53_07515 [Candidatus Peribacteria bacterium]|jgi:hypothetical protein|nr:hypothetical protein [Candidatus Peribacteria bacterium]
MRLSVVFATRANESALPHVRRIFGCLASQTFQDFEVVVVCDREFANQKEFDEFYEKLDSSPSYS